MQSTVEAIVRINDGLKRFWSQASGWAPIAAAQLLNRSRLDWQVSLSHTLFRWLPPFRPDEAHGFIILGYANVGALVEGSLKLFFSVWYEDYRQDVDAIRKKERIVDPDALTIESLKILFDKRITKKFTSWIQHIQERRNAIHAFRSRPIGSQQDLKEDIRRYLEFLPLLSKLALGVEPPPVMVGMDGCPTSQPERRLNSESGHERVQPDPPTVLTARV
jgi:hypothetical protein